MTENVDRLGVVASSLCAVHCVACAAAPAIFGVFGIGFIYGHDAEWGFTLIAVGFAALALVLGWRKHRSVVVMSFLGLGIAGLLASRGIESLSSHHDHGHGHHGDEHHRNGHHDDGHHDGHHERSTHENGNHGKHRTGHDSSENHVQRGHTGRGHHQSSEHSLSADGSTHLIGTAVGVFASVLLLIGHFFNIRRSRNRSTLY